DLVADRRAERLATRKQVDFGGEDGNLRRIAIQGNELELDDTEVTAGSDEQRADNVVHSQRIGDEQGLERVGRYRAARTGFSNQSIEKAGLIVMPALDVRADVRCGCDSRVFVFAKIAVVKKHFENPSSIRILGAEDLGLG